MDWIIHYIINQIGPKEHLINAHTHNMNNYLHLDFQVVLNLPQDHICYLLNSMGKRVQIGETFHDGDLISGLYTDCEIRLKKVKETGRDVLRLVIPDKHNKFPEDEGCMAPYKYQELNMFE